MKPIIEITILTIFPELFPGPLKASITGKALEDNIWKLNTINIRDFGLGKHKKVDDSLYGGGDGLLMRADVLGNAIDSVITPKSKLIYMSPKGKKLDQQYLCNLSKLSDLHLIILCGRFKGIDQRIIDHYNVTELSIGDYVLSGGELASMVFLEALLRLYPKIVSCQGSVESDSFFPMEDANEHFSSTGLLECPHYTKPCSWRDMKVPDVLLSGNHNLIKEWRLGRGLEVTANNRPDLLIKK